MTKTLYPPVEWVTERMHIGLGQYKSVRLISKQYFLDVYAATDISRVDFIKLCGCNESKFVHCYHHWFTDKERRIIGGRKISFAQRNSNSNRANTGTPRIILDLAELKAMIASSYSLQKMANLFEVAPQTVLGNLEYYKLHVGIVHNPTTISKIISARALDKFFGLSISRGIEVVKIDPHAADVKLALEHLLKAEQNIMGLRKDVRVIRRNILEMLKFRGINIGAFKLPTTGLNSLAKTILNELGYDVLLEFELGGKYFDFKFKGYKLLLEIDSNHFHSSPEQLKNDKLKTRIAETSGYTLLRVFTDKDKKPALRKKLEQCLDNLELRKSLL